MDTKTALALLRLKKGASAKRLKKAYRAVAFETHPDKGGNQLDFIQATTAYNWLKEYGTHIQKRHVVYARQVVVTQTWVWRQWTPNSNNNTTNTAF